jgi:hypothetical protein
MSTSNPLNNSKGSHNDGMEIGHPSFSDIAELTWSVDEGKSSDQLKSLEGASNNASIFSCFVNLANTILGSGMLGLPYAFAHTGWIFGSCMILVCGMSSSFALHTLALCALEVPGPSSFYAVANNVLPMFTALIDFAVAIKCFGVATSYVSYSLL